MHAKREADAILDEFQPDLIVGTGGYASYPVVRYGHARGIPTAVHESNIVPGLTTRQLESHCERIMVGFEECRAHYKHPEKVVVTGTPVRGDFFIKTKEQAKEALGDLARSEEDIMSYICYPDQAMKFFEDRKAKEENICTYVIEEA